MKSLYVIYFKMYSGEEIYYTKKVYENSCEYVIGGKDINDAVLYKSLRQVRDIVEYKRETMNNCKEVCITGRYAEDYRRVEHIGIMEVVLQLGDKVE